jgi:hypothetical protein
MTRDKLFGKPHELKRRRPGSAEQPKDGAAPTYDRDRRSLFFLGRLVKALHRSAGNQELILLAFQELRWPPRIDDPLPIMPGKNPKKRLHDTIESLNELHEAPLLRFGGDGTGCGVRWWLLDPSPIDHR